MLQTRWTPLTFGQLCTSCRPAWRARTTEHAKPPLSWFLLIQMNMKLRGSKCNVAAVKQAAAKFTSPTSEVGETNDQGSCTGGRARSNGWRNAAMRLLDGLREDQLCFASGQAPEVGQLSHTAQRNHGQRLLTVVPRNQGQGSKCRSPCPRKLRPIAWAEVLVKLAEKLRDGAAQ